MSKEKLTAGFHMVQLAFMAKELTILGRMLRLNLRHVGVDYLVHCAIGELFQDQAPGPFSIESSTNGGRSTGALVRVLAYSDVDADTLRELARGFASPAVYSVCRWEEVVSKPMPSDFAAGQVLGFSVRACPVIRKSSAGRKWAKGQEIDVFLSKVWETDDHGVSLDRQAVYRDWLSNRVAHTGGADVEYVEVVRFAIERMTRRTHGDARKSQIIKRPDVDFTGRLRVSDPASFRSILRRGIGRHRSFGFGMLKIRRA